MANVFGVALKRREDPRLITGKGNYTEDVQLPGMPTRGSLESTPTRPGNCQVWLRFIRGKIWKGKSG
jgi:hypothetical protein